MRISILKCWALPVLVLYLVARAAAQPLSTAEPESVGVSSHRLQQIAHLVQRRLHEGKLVGAVTMVARRGELVHFEAFGKADVDSDTEMKKDAIFRIYSMTKPITSVAAMMLYEEGKFQLGDPVWWYIPQFKNLKVYADDSPDGSDRQTPRRAMTIRDLMAHTSGLTYGAFGNSPVDRLYRKANPLDSSGTLKDMADKLGNLPLLHHPGDRWHYSVSTDVLGYLVEVWSGMTLDEFFRQRIFDPLQMHDTAFFVPEGKTHRLPVNYSWDSSGQRHVADRSSDSRYGKPATFYSGGGGLVSTARDYMRFCQMLLSGGELENVRLLSPKTVRLMTKNHLGRAAAPTEGSPPGPGAGFGLGFRVITNVAANQRLGSVGTYSWGGLASTFFFIDPQEQLVAIVMTQKLPTDLRLRDEFLTAVYQSIVDSVAD